MRHTLIILTAIILGACSTSPAAGPPQLPNDEPPAILLNTASEEQIEGQQGSYCWGGICADYIFPTDVTAFTRLETLAVEVDGPPPDEVVMVLFESGATPPNFVTEETLAVTDDGVYQWTPAVEGDTYLLMVQALWNNRGDTSAFFGVDLVGTAPPPTDMQQPPTASIVAATGSQPLTLNSFCWSPPTAEGEPQVPGLCADGFFPPRSLEETYDVLGGERLRFRINDPQPETASVTVWEAPAEGQTALDIVLDTTELTALGSGSYLIEPIDLAAGDYLVGVGANWTDQGSAQYVALIRVSEE